MPDQGLEDISHTRRVADSMAEPERSNFDLVGSFFGEDDENDIFETVMQNHLKRYSRQKAKQQSEKQTTVW